MYLFTFHKRRGGGHSAALVDLQCILGSERQIIHHNDIINERLGLLHLVLVFLTLHGFAQASYRSEYPKKVVIVFQFFFQNKTLLIKKLEIEKTKPTFIISVLKVVY